MRSRFVRCGLPAVVGFLLAPFAAAQLPDEFQNLKVLPEDIDKQELVGMMRAFSGALGVRCWYCHVGEEGKPLRTFDFASDEKSGKRVAREMLKMLGEINATVGKIDTGHDPKLEVSCATCHHGVSRPRGMRDILEEVHGADGIEAALARYRELREEYYGGYAYDFDPGPLNLFAESLVKQGKLDEALAVQQMNAEFHPDRTFVHFMIGQIYEQKGDKEKAIGAYERALEVDSSNSFAQRRLKGLRRE